MPRNLALFDLDHTLIPIDSDVEWGNFLCRRGIVDEAWYRRRNDDFYEMYKAGTLDIREFLDFCLAPLASLGRSELDALHADFMAEVIVPAIRPVARDLVETHRRQGDLCAIVTATNAFVTAPIATAFGIEHLIATIPAQQDGRFTGGVRGTPSYRDGKVERVEAWLESLAQSWSSFDRSTFYSDSKNDLALLERVTHPVATNADATLLSIAQARGWRILNLLA